MDAWAWSAIETMAYCPGDAAGRVAVLTVRPADRRGPPALQGSSLGHLALNAGVRRRFAPHQLRHAHAVELLHTGIPLPVIQRQLGHSHLSTTGTYLEGINNKEIISTVHARRAAMMHASAGLAL